MIKKKIIDRIQKEKKGISLQEFICICLYDKDGYYKISNPIGKSGDFTTSPEISQLFVAICSNDVRNYNSANQDTLIYTL